MSGCAVFQFSRLLSCREVAFKVLPVLRQAQGNRLSENGSGGRRRYRRDAICLSAFPLISDQAGTISAIENHSLASEYHSDTLRPAPRAALSTPVRLNFRQISVRIVSPLSMDTEKSMAWK